MTSTNYQKILDIALQNLNGTVNCDTQMPGFSERIIEVPWAAQWFAKILQDQEKPKHLLDIGLTMSSLDWLGLLLELKRANSIKIQAVDIVQPERVKSRYPEEWLNDIFNIPISTNDVRLWKPEPEAYDIVSCISTIEHIGFDEASEDDPATAFKRGKTIEDVVANRSPNVNADVMSVFERSLKSGGYVLMTTPMGRGGATLLKDSLGLYTRQWEYEQDSWDDLVQQPGFKLIEQRFFKFDSDKIWREVASPRELSNQSSELKAHAHGCALVVLQKK